ncbi:MAG: hypothetical protein ACOCRO_06360 [Halanaerobiales bacterium]
MRKRKIFLMLATIVMLLLIISCYNSRKKSKNEMDKQVLKNTSEIKDESTSYLEDDEKSKEDSSYIVVEIFGGSKLKIEKERFNDDIYGTGQLDNKWTLEEIDTILHAVQGEWTIDSYEGFVAAPIYLSDLFVSDNLDETVRKELLDGYNAEIELAKNNIPKFTFSIKKYGSNSSNTNYIVVNNYFLSPMSIILSLNKISENYPVFVDRTGITMDVDIQYPVAYIKFFANVSLEEGNVEYKPITLIMSNDEKLYVLIGGAYYSVVSK